VKFYQIDQANRPQLNSSPWLRLGRRLGRRSRGGDRSADLVLHEAAETDLAAAARREATTRLLRGVATIVQTPRKTCDVLSDPEHIHRRHDTADYKDVRKHVVPHAAAEEDPTTTTRLLHVQQHLPASALFPLRNQ